MHIASLRNSFSENVGLVKNLIMMTNKIAQYYLSTKQIFYFLK